MRRVWCSCRKNHQIVYSVLCAMFHRGACHQTRFLGIFSWHQKMGLHNFAQKGDLQGLDRQASHVPDRTQWGTLHCRVRQNPVNHSEKKTTQSPPSWGWSRTHLKTMVEIGCGDAQRGGGWTGGRAEIMFPIPVAPWWLFVQKVADHKNKKY